MSTPNPYDPQSLRDAQTDQTADAIRNRLTAIGHGALVARDARIQELEARIERQTRLINEQYRANRTLNATIDRLRDEVLRLGGVV